MFDRPKAKVRASLPNNGLIDASVNSEHVLPSPDASYLRTVVVECCSPGIPVDMNESYVSVAGTKGSPKALHGFLR